MRERKPCAPIFFLLRLPSSLSSRAIWSFGHHVHVHGRALWQDGWSAVVAGSRSVTNACTCSNGLGYVLAIKDMPAALQTLPWLVSSWACASESIWHHLQQQTTHHRSTDSASPATRRKSGSHPVCSMFIYAGVVYYSLRPALDSRDHLPCLLLWVLRERERERDLLSACIGQLCILKECRSRLFCMLCVPFTSLLLAVDIVSCLRLFRRQIKAPSHWNAHLLRSRLFKRRRQGLKVDTQATVDLYFALHH